MKLGEIMTVGEFKRKFSIWGLSIAAFLIVVLIALAIWQEEKNYAFYGVPAVLAGLFVALPISMFIVAAKEVDNKKEKKSKKDEAVIAEPKEEIKVVEFKTLPVMLDPLEEITPIATQVDIPEKTEKEEINEKIDGIIFESMTVVELRDYAKAKGLTGYTTLKKVELIELLKKNA